MKIEWCSPDAADAGAALQQSLVYADAMRRLGVAVRQAHIFADGAVAGQGLVLERRGFRLISRGPVWHGDLPAAARLRGLRLMARQPALLLATPEQPLTGIGAIPLITGRYVATWDLAAEPAVLRAGLWPKWRNALVAAETRGMQITPLPYRDLDEVLLAEAAQRRVRGYRALPAAFVRAIAPGNLRLWQWRKAGQMQAAMCFIRHGRVASYHMAYASPLARHCGVHRLMLWRAMLALREESVAALDLGDVNTSTAAGLARFKLGTGADLRQLGATLWVLPR